MLSTTFLAHPAVLDGGNPDVKIKLFESTANFVLDECCMQLGYVLMVRLAVSPHAHIVFTGEHGLHKSNHAQQPWIDYSRAMSM